MRNFEFHAPTQIIFGQNQIARLAELIPIDARILMLYGQGSIKNNGTYAEVKAALSAHIVFEFSGIRPNPDYDDLLPALSLIQEARIDFILSVGGGSVIDAGKFLAAAAIYKGDPWDLVLDTTLINTALAHGAVLTLPATGTEMNRWGVISRRSLTSKRDFGHKALYLRFAILDPAKTFTLPLRQIINGIVDAFTHVIEQYVTYPIDAALQNRQAEAVLLTLIEEGRRVLAVPESYEARANFMWAATNALNGQIEAGMVYDGTTHMIGHELTALYGIDHGASLAVILPATFKVLRQQKQEKLIQYGQKVWGINLPHPEALVAAAIQMTEDFFRSIGAKTRLHEYGITAEDLVHIADKLEQQRFLPLGECKNVDKNLVLQILRESY